MKKSIKIILISAIAIILCLIIAVLGFFAVYPMSPKVEIKSAEEKISNFDTLLIGSYNTAAPWGNLLEGTYTTRRMHLFAQQINDTLPDSLGVQEINSIWVEGLEDFLPQYAYYGVKRGGDENEQKSEMNGIYYLKDKFELIESDTFWLSDTPEKESRYKDAGCNRVCSYVILKSKATGFVFAHLNTHLDNSSVEAQNLGGRLVNEKAEELSKKYKDIAIVITGDFNQYSDGVACKISSENNFANAGASFDNKLTYNGWTRDTEGRPIDFIFINDGFTATNYKVHSDTNTKSNISDHYMITAELNIK